MKVRFYVVGMVFLLMLALAITVPAGELSTKKLWDKVTEAQGKGLPQTAIDNLKEIHKLALKENRQGEALKALSLQIVLETTIKGNKPEYKVNRLRAEVAKADPSIKPLMNGTISSGTGGAS